MLPNTAAVNTSAACNAGLIAGRVTASAASTIPCLVKCIFQQAKVLEGKVFPLLLLSSAMTFFQGKRNETFPERFTIVS